MLRRTPYVSVNVTIPARDTLQHATAKLTGAADRRLSMSEALIAALEVALNHQEELVETLSQNNANRRGGPADA